jgi:hypothetical protein
VDILKVLQERQRGKFGKLSNLIFKKALCCRFAPVTDVNLFVHFVAETPKGLISTRTANRLLVKNDMISQDERRHPSFRICSFRRGPLIPYLYSFLENTKTVESQRPILLM